MKNTITWVLRIFIGIVGLMLLYPGFMWSFMPEANLLQNSIEVNSILGINFLKSGMGTALLTTAIFMFLFLFKGEKWFLPSVILMATFLLIRVVSLIVDGSHTLIIAGILVEFISLIAMWGLNKLQRENHSQQ